MAWDFSTEPEYAEQAGLGQTSSSARNASRST
jgi:hypothetical protein